MRDFKYALVILLHLHRPIYADVINKENISHFSVGYFTNTDDTSLWWEFNLWHKFFSVYTLLLTRKMSGILIVFDNVIESWKCQLCKMQIFLSLKICCWYFSYYSVLSTCHRKAWHYLHYYLIHRLICYIMLMVEF